MPRLLTIWANRYGQGFKKDEVNKVVIEDGGKPCDNCSSSCALDERMPCAPDCENLKPNDTRNTASCLPSGCDACKLNIGDYVFDASCGEEGFVVSLSTDRKIARVQYLTSNGPEEDIVACEELESSSRPDKEFDIAEACCLCEYLHHANNCTIQPGEYCKRYHRFEASVQKEEVYTAEILLSTASLTYYRELLSMSGAQIYQKYGLKRDELITHTAHFPNGFEADIKIVICEGDTPPYIDAVLFDSTGCEVACESNDDGDYAGAYQFKDHAGHSYAVDVCEVKRTME